MIRSDGMDGAYERRRGSLSCSVFNSFGFGSEASSLAASASASVVSAPESAGVGVEVVVPIADARFFFAAALDTIVAGVELRLAATAAAAAAAALLLLVPPMLPFPCTADPVFPDPCIAPVPPLALLIAASSSSKWFRNVF